MNKDELVRKLAEEFGISTIDIYQLVNTVVSSMSNALSKGKNINVSEFGKFKTLSRRDEAGKTIKTVSFSPVKKFAHDVNFRYNDLSPTPIGLVSQKEEDSPGEEVSLTEVVSENITFDKNLSENINSRVMDNKDKYDENIIRDEISQDSQNDSSDSIEAFIRSKLEKSQSTEHNESGGIKEFELPHTLIELHNDITNEEVEENNVEETFSSENPDNNERIDIESLIEERKRALEDKTPDHQSPQNHEQTNDSTINEKDESTNLQIEDRDKPDEFKSFEEERNAELNKIIAERNKIIDDINNMVNNSDDMPIITEPPVEEKSFDRPIENTIESTTENIIENEQVEEPILEEPVKEEKPAIEDIPPLQKDRTFEHKFQYDESNLMEDNFDPIATNEEIDYAKNDILTPEDTQIFKDEHNSFENAPKSFEDVFETKDSRELQKQERHIHSELPQINQEKVQKDEEVKKDIPPPPVHSIPKSTAPQSGSYTEKMRKREQMYEEKSNKSAKKGFWITAIILGFLVLVIYLAYNTGTFSPPVQQTDGNQPNNTGQNPQQQQSPPVTSEQTKEQENTSAENKQEESNQPVTNTPEEVIFDNSLNLAFIKASDGIYIQTASLKNKSDADRMASGISNGNKEVFVKEADLGDKGTYYRVRIGKFTTMDEAKEFAGKLK